MDAKLMDAPPAAPIAAQPPPLTAGVVASFSIGAIASSAGGVLIQGGNLTYYLNQVIGMDPLLVGAGITASLVLDAVIDPFIGQWSDHVRSPLGRRHPFMYAAAVLAPLSYLLFWHTPHLSQTAGFVVYVFFCLALARVTTSAFELTSVSMIPELAPGYNVRTWLISWATLFGLISGAALGVIFNVMFVRRDAAHPLGLLNRAGYESFSVLCAAIVFAAMLISALGTQSRARAFHTPPVRRVSPGAAFRQLGHLFSNLSLLVVLINGLLSATAAGVTAGMNLYLLTYFWGLDPQQFAILAPIAALCGVLAILGAPILSARFGKKPTMLGALLLGLFTSWIPIVLKLVGLMPSGPTLVVIILAVDLAISTTLTIMGVIVRGSMISDVVEDNAVKTGHRAEALVFAAQGLTPKIAAGLGFLISGAILAWVHFPKHAAKGAVSPELMRQLVLIYLPVTAVMSLTSILALCFYRIDKSAHELNLARLRDGALGADSSLDQP